MNKTNRQLAKQNSGEIIKRIPENMKLKPESIDKSAFYVHCKSYAIDKSIEPKIDRIIADMDECEKLDAKMEDKFSVRFLANEAINAKNLMVGMSCLLYLEKEGRVSTIRNIQKHAKRLDVKKTANIILNESGERTNDYVQEDLAKFERRKENQCSETIDYEIIRKRLKSVQEIQELKLELNKGIISYENLARIAISETDEFIGAWCIYRLYVDEALTKAEKMEFIGNIIVHAGTIGIKMIATRKCEILSKEST